MASDVTDTVIQGFGVPLKLSGANLWEDKATYTQQGPLSGEAVAQGSYSLVLQTAGAQAADKKLRVKVQRGGHPGPGGVEVIHQDDGDGSGVWQGHDVQQAAAYQVIRSEVSGLTGGLFDPDATTFTDGDNLDRIAVVYQRRNTTSGTTYDVECAVYDPAAGTWSTATVYTSGSNPADGYHPCIAFNKLDGHLYVCHWIYDTSADLAQIATHRSADGTTWETVSDWALDAGVDVSSLATAYEVSRLRMAFNAGQCLLVAHVVSNNTSLTHRDWVAQFASTSRAARFTTVEVAQVTIFGGTSVFFSRHSVTVINGSFVVWYPFGSVAGGGVPAIGVLGKVPLPSAITKLSSRSLYLVSTADPILAFRDSGATFSPVQYTGGKVTNGEGSVWVAGDGTIYAAHRVPIGETGTVSDGGTFLNSSTDGGTDWKYLGDGDNQATYASGALVFYSGDSATYLRDFVGVSHRGRQCLIGLSESDTTTSSHLVVLWCGGSTNVNLPARITYPQPYQQSSWTEAYLPFELPANVSSLATTSSSGTDTIGSDGYLNRSTSSGTQYSDFTPTTTPAQGLVVRYAHTLNSGGNNNTEADVLRIRTADGSNTYEVSLRFDGDGFRLFDVQDGAAIGADKDTVDPNSGIDVLVALVNGKLSCWFRAISYLADNPWTAGVQNHSLVDGGSASSSNLIRFGIGATSSADIDVHELHYMEGAVINGALGTGFTNPDDLRGRPIPRRGRFATVADGTSITGVDGSGKKGDTFHIDTAYTYPITRLFHADSPSPRAAWRSVAVTSGNVPAQLIPFVVNADATTFGAEEQGLGSTLCYLTMAGVNWQNATIQRWDTGSSAWVTVATIDNSISTTYAYIRRGSELVAPSVPTTSSGHYFQTNECRGWTVKLGTTYRKIAGNTAGTLASYVFGPKPTFFLEGIDGSEPTLSTLTLIPDRFTVVFHTAGETGGGWAVNIAAQATAPYTAGSTTQYDLAAGHLSLGHVHVFGEAYSYGRVLAYEPDERTEDTPGGVRRATVLGPGGRRVRLSWTDPVDISQTQGSTADPDYIKSSSTSGNLAVATRAGTPFDVMGLLRSVGVGTPLTYLPRIAVSTGAADVQHMLRYQDHMLGQLTTPVQLESVIGNESDSTDGELMRVATMVMEEIR